LYRLAGSTLPLGGAYQTQKNRCWWHESPGGPSTPLDGFWKFSENAKETTISNLHIPTHPKQHEKHIHDILHTK